MDIKAIKSKLFEIVEPVVKDEGLEVVDIHLVREGGGWVLRLFLDRLPSAGAQAAELGEGVAIGDCERISRELSATLDVADPVPCAYSLEVSSAGIDRPLRTAAHFERFAGQRAKVRLEAGLDGRRNFTGLIVGTEGEQENQVLLLEADGATKADPLPVRLPLNDLATAKLIPDWEALLGGGKKTSKRSGAAGRAQSNENRAK